MSELDYLPDDLLIDQLIRTLKKDNIFEETTENILISCYLTLMASGIVTNLFLVLFIAHDKKLKSFDNITQVRGLSFLSSADHSLSGRHLSLLSGQTRAGERPTPGGVCQR